MSAQCRKPTFGEPGGNDGFVPAPDLHGGVRAIPNERQVLGTLISALNGDNWGAFLNVRQDKLAEKTLSLRYLGGLLPV